MGRGGLFGAWRCASGLHTFTCEMLRHRHRAEGPWGTRGPAADHACSKVTVQVSTIGVAPSPSPRRCRRSRRLLDALCMGRGGGAIASDVGDFDLYILAQTWAPHFCCRNADRCSTVPWAFSAKHLSLHGLWPGWATPRSGHPSPLNCATKAQLLSEQLPREYVDVAPSFTVWNAKKHVAEVGELAKHEWRKHGTCSGLSPNDYFSEALRALQLLPGDRGTPAILTQNTGGSVGAAELRAQYGRRVALRADKACRLSEVTSCWSKGADGRIGVQVDCPEHVMRGRDNGSCSRLLIGALGQCFADDGKTGHKPGRKRASVTVHQV